MSHTLPEGNAIQRAFKLEPAVLRGTLVGITTVVAVITGKTIETGWVEDLLFIYAAVSPIVAGLFIRKAVSPVVRVQELIERARLSAEENLRNRPNQ